VCGVHGACSHAKVKFVFEGEIGDYFSFAFVSPEGAYDNRAGHSSHRSKVCRELFKLVALFGGYCSQTIFSYIQLGYCVYDFPIERKFCQKKEARTLRPSNGLIAFFHCASIRESAR